MEGKSIPFQKYDSKLAVKLEETIKSDNENLLVCLPDVFNSVKQYKKSTKRYWTMCMGRNRKKWCSLLNENKTYYNAFISRPYMMYKDKSNCGAKFDKINSIWKKRDIVIIEGEKSRLGIGNDLFKDCNSIKRILGPKTDAFSKYDEIIDIAKKQDENSLILIALGPTATIMANELTKCGFQAIDIGHIDIEYEWFLRGYTKSEKINGKYTNEVQGGEITEDLSDDIYNNQIIYKVV